MKRVLSLRQWLLAAAILATVAGAGIATAQQSEASVARCGRNDDCVCIGWLWCTDQWHVGDPCQSMWDCGWP